MYFKRNEKVTPPTLRILYITLHTYISIYTKYLVNVLEEKVQLYEICIVN